ncbi:crotonobetainyl-CoA:carnitine CoA-transferase CaiB-like acyl-CoA transferase [Sphingomonas kyeonggiensis]|uniref:Crotonobetainyl-CoA:carnitine CoA-transferase CaiB-like acyl-CoA transferase n=1 Tax=Sphingomonas kyeonggiensis TaxID=1268553 RepID=A0A7W7K2P5_9SPHN|nr:CoA transferase [Sphingomonas kyeonggiensis]MBB4839951.1 crotonobetainyl-CoA:carnitine CoA-transferase CaiB-like acyl-CoA transferase [Sphingomonas kyeonggiensis]
MGAPAPLAGVTVLDFSQFLAGPSCALRLADLGARVIKVERREGGDASRGLFLADMAFDQDSALFHAINRGKQSYAADLKDPEDLEAVRRLVARADVLIHNFRPGIMERLGLGWADVSALNPRLIYAGVSGYGPDGPWRDKPGQDLLVQSLSGIAWLSGEGSGPPVPAGLSITDMMAGAQLAQGILALLVRRGTTGQGGRVDVSLIETAIDLQFEHLSVHLNRDEAMPARSSVANGNVYLAAPYGIYQTQDGWLALAMAPVDKLGTILDLETLAGFPPTSWFAERDAIKAQLRDHLRTRPTADWLALLEPAGIWAAPVLDWPALRAEPAFAALHATQTVRSPDGAELTLTRCPIRIDGSILTSPPAAPRLGADRTAIDREFAA